MADDAGALLVRSGLITPSALDQARAQVAELGGTIGEQLVTAGAIDDDALTEFYTSRLLVPQVNPNSLARLPIRVTAAIPNDMAIALRAVPVALDDENNLTIAMSDPSDRHAVDEIGFFTGAFVVRACATQMQIAWCLAHYYGHVTPLGQRLLQPGADPVPAPVATPAPVSRVKGVTAQVKAARHKRIQPTSEVGDDTDPVVAPAPSKRAPSIKPPLPVEDIDSGPVITIEPAPDAEATAPRKAPAPKRRNVQPDPPELYARGGEIDVNTGKIKRIDVEQAPSIVVDDAIDDGNHVADRAGELEVRDTGNHPTAPQASIEIDDSFDRESRPILLEQRVRGPGDSVTFRQRAPSVADFPDDDDEVVVLQPKKVPGRQRPTQVGLGVLPAATRAAADDAAPPALDDAVTAQVASVPDDDDGLGPTTAVMSAVELDAAIPERSAEVIPGHLQPGRRAFTDDPDDPDDPDDGWGPPGTTIPPPLLGAIPGSDDDAVPGRIPVGDMESAPLIVAPPSPPQASRSSPSIAASGDAGRALEDATTALLALIRDLEHASTRDDVVRMMIEHLAATHRRAGFFVIKAGPAKGSTELSVFAVTPRPATVPIATLRLDRPSTLQDVVGTRLPYRGPMHDDDSRTFLASALGSAPAELLLVPIAVRERVVGVLFGDHRVRHTFDDQLALASRAAGQALERILKAKRG